MVYNKKQCLPGKGRAYEMMKGRTIMIKFQATIKGKEIRMYSSSPLTQTGEMFIRTLNRISDKTDIFQENFMLQYGWAPFFLKPKTEEDGTEVYVVESFDFLQNPPKRTEDCSSALVIQNMQFDTFVRSKTPRPEPTTFKDKVLVLREALNAPDVYMHRADVTKDGDSGWYFGLLNDEREEEHTDEELVSVQSWELMKFRAEALRVLMLPVGTVAVFHDNEMTALVDGEDHPLDFSTAEERRKAIAAAAARKPQTPAEEGNA